MEGKEQQTKHLILEDSYLKPFQKGPSLTKAKQAFVAYHDKGVPIPDAVIAFFAAKFSKEIELHEEKPPLEKNDNERAILVELMIRIARSKDNVSIKSICQEMAEEIGMQGDGTHSAGELLQHRMENFKKRSKVRKA